MDFDIIKIVMSGAINAQIAITNFASEYARANPRTVTAALYLYFKGVSLRKFCDHYQVHWRSISGSSISTICYQKADLVYI
jgi:hypothetical protein